MASTATVVPATKPASTAQIDEFCGEVLRFLRKPNQKNEWRVSGAGPLRVFESAHEDYPCAIGVQFAHNHASRLGMHLATVMSEGEKITAAMVGGPSGGYIGAYPAIPSEAADALTGAAKEFSHVYQTQRRCAALHKLALDAQRQQMAFLLALGGVAGDSRTPSVRFDQVGALIEFVDPLAWALGKTAHGVGSDGGAEGPPPLSVSAGRIGIEAIPELLAILSRGAP